MKIRNGFVSNSSSSSFIVFAKPIRQEELINKKFKNPLYAKGNGYFSEGEDFFPLTDEMIKFISDHPEKIKNICMYEVFDCFNSESLHSIAPGVRKDKNVLAMSFEKSYHCTESLSDFKMHYVEDGDEDE